MWKAKHVESTAELEQYLNESDFVESSLNVTIFNKSYILVAFKTK